MTAPQSRFAGTVTGQKVVRDLPTHDLYELDPAELGLVEDRSDTVNSVGALVSLVWAEHSVEVPTLRQYVLDVALGADGEPLVVELNGLLNAGLYASDRTSSLERWRACSQPTSSEWSVRIESDTECFSSISAGATPCYATMFPRDRLASMFPRDRLACVSGGGP